MSEIVVRVRSQPKERIYVGREIGGATRDGEHYSYVLAGLTVVLNVYKDNVSVGQYTADLTDLLRGMADQHRAQRA